MLFGIVLIQLVGLSLLSAVCLGLLRIYESTANQVISGAGLFGYKPPPPPLWRLPPSIVLQPRIVA